MLRKMGYFSASTLAATAFPMEIAGAFEVSPEGDFGISGGSNAGCLRTIFKMGHCAPSVMNTLIGNGGEKYEETIKLVAGLPGGIGNYGAECGGVTSAVMYLGREMGYEETEGNIPKLIVAGREYLKRFKSFNGSIYCRDIQTPDGGIKPCMQAMCCAKKIVSGLDLPFDSSIGDGAREAYALALKNFQRQAFHCSHSVLTDLGDIVPVDDDLLKMSWGFVGGTLLSGNTCGALTAGVLAIGSKVGEIEDSYLRVMNMMAKMMTGGDAMADDVNKFNRAINVGNRLMSWFEEEYKSTTCADVASVDFANRESVGNYINSGGVSRCRNVAKSVAKKVREILVEG
jgi:C_GCAxxG_C_C family probable redox protein